MMKVFFAEWRSHTPYFREIPREYLRWLMECEPPVSLPPFLIELAHYEWAELAVDVMEAPVPDDIESAGDLLDARPVLNPALMNLAYEWPVHRIGPGYRPRRPKKSQILVYRKHDHKVRFIEVNPVSARLVALLQAGTSTGREALIRIATELVHADPETVINSGIAILNDLHQEEVILGTRK